MLSRSRKPSKRRKSRRWRRFVELKSSYTFQISRFLCHVDRESWNFCEFSAQAPKITIRCNKAQKGIIIRNWIFNKTKRLQQSFPEPSHSPEIVPRGTISNLAANYPTAPVSSCLRALKIAPRGAISASALANFRRLRQAKALR